MPKEKTYLIQNVFILFYLVMFSLAIYLLWQVKVEQKETNNAMNAYADVWCQNQSYEYIVNQTPNPEYENKYCYQEYFYVKNNFEEWEKINGSITNIDTRIIDEFIYGGDNLSISEEYQAMFLLITPFDHKYERIVCPTINVMGTKHYATGAYLQKENQIECYNAPKPKDTECSHRFFSSTCKVYMSYGYDETVTKQFDNPLIMK